MRYMQLLAVSALFATAAAMQDDGGAAALLREVSETYKHLGSFHFEAESHGELTMGTQHGSWMNSKLVLAVSGRDRIHYETSDTNGAFLVVSDGKTLWRANRNTREYVVTPVAETGWMDTKGGGPSAPFALRRAKVEIERLWKLEENLKSAKVIREDAVEIDGQRIPCTVIEAHYDPPAAIRDDFDLMRRTFWIDKARKLILQEESLNVGRAAPSMPFETTESRWRIRYTRAILGEPPDAKTLFAWNPPANFRWVESLEMNPAHSAGRELIGKPAPALIGKTLDGANPISLEGLRGKVVLLDFWATWCAPCREQMPRVAELYGKLKDKGAVLLGVSDDESPATALAYMKERKYEWPGVVEEKFGTARSNFRVRAIPALVLIDQQGVIVEHQVGKSAESEQKIRAALAKLGIDTQP